MLISLNRFIFPMNSVLALAVAARSHPYNVRRPIRTSFEDFLLLNQSQDKPKPNIVWFARLLPARFLPLGEAVQKMFCAFCVVFTLRVTIIALLDMT